MKAGAFVSVFGAAALAVVAGHGAMRIPLPRNNVDWEDPQQGSATYPVDGFACPSPNGTALTGVNGQSCYWFSNGCAIGCKSCDGNSRGPIPSSADPAYKRKFNLCPDAKAKASVCDPKLRTVNTGAKCGASDDWYYYSPWRAPGSAPVFDSCGMAGGRLPSGGGFGATYVNTAHAKQGDMGSKTLPRAPPQTTWRAGEEVEVSWSILANHGGGYQYRLCPANQPLTEECFQKTPLPFVGMQSFRWDAEEGVGGKQTFFQGTYVSEGTTPAGSTWAMNPIPRNDTHQTGASFAPRCKEVPNCGSTSRLDSKCTCSGMWGPYNLEIVDKVQVPHDLPQGDYVLSFRWDCEESNQIWASCADIAVRSAHPSKPEHEAF